MRRGPLLLPVVLVVLLVGPVAGTSGPPPALGGGENSGPAPPMPGASTAAPVPSLSSAVARAAGTMAPGPAVSGSVGGIYYFAYYDGPTENITTTWAQMEVPTALPDPNDSYAVMLDIVDNSSLQDGVGFLADNGSWTAAYSISSACSAAMYNSGGTALQPGATYNFSLQVAAGTITSQITDPTNGSLVWSRSTLTGAGTFVATKWHTCPALNVVYDFVTSEVGQNVTAPFIPFNFAFDSVEAGGQPVTAWATYGSGTDNGLALAAVVTGSNVTLLNEPWGLVGQLGTGSDTLEMRASSSSQVVNVSMGVTKFLTSPNVRLAGGDLPTGWSVNVSALYRAPAFSADAGIGIPAAASPGNYSVPFEATQAKDGPWIEWAFWVDLVGNLSVRVAANPGASLDLGQTVQFAATVSGVIGRLNLSWNTTLSGCATSGATLRCQPNATGNFTVQATVTDGTGSRVASLPVQVQVASPPILRLVGPPAFADIGQTATWSASASNGTPPFSVSWLGLPMGCLPSGASAECRLTYVGTVSPSVNLTDATGASLLGEFAPLTVASAPSASVAESRSQVDVGQPARFRVIGSGGSGDYLAQWPSLPTGCAATGGNVTCVFEQPGVFTLAAEITDAAGVAANASNSVVVDAALAIALTAFPLKVDEGAVVLLNATAEGGMPAYGFQYLGLWPGCASADVARLSCPTMEPGPWNLSLMVTDANGFTVNSAPIIVQIFPRPAVTLFVTPSMPRAGAAFTVLALPDGGQAPYRFNWTAVPADCAAPLGPNLTCQAAFGENDSFGVAVTDAAGRTAGSSLEVEVSGPPPPPTSPAAPPPAFPWSTLVVLGAIAAAVAVGAVVLARQRPPRTPVEDADPAGGSEYLDLNGPGNDSRGGG